MNIAAISSVFQEWLEMIGWDKVPVVSEGGVQLEFRLAVRDQYGLDCKFDCIVESKICSLLAHPEFQIPVTRVRDVNVFCTRMRREAGKFWVTEEGHIYYLDARGLDVYTVSPDLLTLMMNGMDEYVSSVAEGVVILANDDSLTAETLLSEHLNAEPTTKGADHG